MKIAMSTGMSNTQPLHCPHLTVRECISFSSHSEVIINALQCTGFKLVARYLASRPSGVVMMS